MAPSRNTNLPKEAEPDEPASSSGATAVTPATAAAASSTTAISPAATTKSATRSEVPTPGGSTPAGTTPAATAPTAITSTGTAAAAELPRTIEPAAELSAAEPPAATAPTASAAAAEPAAAKVGRRRSKEQSESSQLKPKQSKAKTDSITKQLTQYSETEQSIAADLSYSEARMALELSLAQLQASDLDVESMTGLFNRAQGYADRCETLLKRVEQEVALWDSDNPEQAPQPYRSA